MTFIVALLFLAQVPQQSSQASQTSISGIVLRATTGDPIAGARITLTRAGDAARPETPAQPAPPPEVATVQNAAAVVPPFNSTAVTTDDRGRFEIKGLAAGTYRVVAARNGFTKQEYGQRSVNRQGRPVTVNAGQRVEDLVFRMTPAATISGRVTDVQGEPLAGVTVQALRSVYDASGKRTLQPAATGRTNDLGEYRLYWMNPGRYFVSANPARSPMDTLAATMSQSTPDSAVDAQAMSQFSSIFGPPPNPNEVAATGFALTFFPGTPELSRAASIDLPPGSESRADFTLALTDRFRVRGHVIDTRTNRPPPSASVSVSARNGIGGGSFFDSLPGMGALQGNRYNPATGEFEVRDVAAGSYWLEVTTQPSIPNAPQGVATPPANILSSINSTQLPIDLYADVDNVTLAVSAGLSIPGRLKMDSNEPLPRVNLSLRPVGKALNFISMITGMAVPDANGTFTIQGVTPGEYKLAISGLPANMYVKDARLENKDPLEGLTILDRIDGALDVTVSSRSGQVDGGVVDADGKAAPNVQVVLVPDRLRNRQDLYKTTATNQDGKFNLRGVAPGDYRVFAWEDIEPFAYFDPDVLKAFETQAKPVRVQESSKATVEARLIPAAY